MLQLAAAVDTVLFGEQTQEVCCQNAAFNVTMTLPRNFVKPTKGDVVSISLSEDLTRGAPLTLRVKVVQRFQNGILLSAGGMVSMVQGACAFSDWPDNFYMSVAVQ